MPSSESSSMKHIVMDGDNPYLPEEIIRTILNRLPVKTLIRFQTVCKHWKNLFKTSSFIQDHLHHSTHQNSFLLFKRYGVSDNHFCLLDRDMQLLEIQNFPLIDSSLGATIIGSSNGLLCVELSRPSRSFLLWNPATREFRQVPNAINFFNGENLYVLYGFGSIVNDYKIVRIHVHVIDHLVNQVEVYSLSTGSWKEVDFGNLDGVSLRSYGFTFNGVIFWFGFKQGVEVEGENNENLIVSFDIAMEVFKLIPLPASIPKSDLYMLTVHENKLAVLSLTVIGNYEYSSIDLWVMEKGTGASDERWSWIKRYTMSPCLGLLLPATIWRHETARNLVLLPGLINATEREVNQERKIVLFNLTTNEVKMISIGKCGLSYNIFNHVESLVPVGNILIEEH